MDKYPEESKEQLLEKVNGDSHLKKGNGAPIRLWLREQAAFIAISTLLAHIIIVLTIDITLKYSQPQQPEVHKHFSTLSRK
jgi:hypothetical protein